MTVIVKAVSRIVGSPRRARAGRARPLREVLPVFHGDEEGGTERTGPPEQAAELADGRLTCPTGPGGFAPPTLRAPDLLEAAVPPPPPRAGDHLHRAGPPPRCRRPRPARFPAKALLLSAAPLAVAAAGGTRRHHLRPRPSQRRRPPTPGPLVPVHHGDTDLDRGLRPADRPAPPARGVLAAADASIAPRAALRPGGRPVRLVGRSGTPVPPCGRRPWARGVGTAA